MTPPAAPPSPHWIFWRPVFRALPVTISAQLRIQSILSPAEPEADDLSGVSSNQSTPKRKFEEAFSPLLAASVAPQRPESLDSGSGSGSLSHTPGHRPRSDGSAAESARGHGDELRTPVPPGSQDGKKPPRMRPPMRSSIACLRCRRSKIKCDNDGGNSPCETCIKAGHQCKYPESMPLPPKRSEPPGGAKQEKDGTHERKRAKKVDDTSIFDSGKSAAYAEEVLSYPFLTSDVWDQCLNIYRLHFATELPFLHLPTLKEKMSLKQANHSDPSSELNLVLLGVLTLTARFHPDLVKYITHMSYTIPGPSRPRPNQPKFEPAAASDFFANALTTSLGPLKTAMTVVTVERVQAFLMLGLFEWSQRSPFSGSGAWMYVGVAIRLAQALRLGLDDKISKVRDAIGGGPSIQPRGLKGSSSDKGIIREIRRRTMFSCLILDRMLACGNERVSSLRSEDLQIQLPCTEMAFDLAMDVHTGFLKPSSETMQRPVNDDSVLSRFIQLVELWGSIAKYSTTGGRLRERVPPWDERSTFSRLRQQLHHFTLDLPDTFTLSRQNYYRHDNHQATNMYVSLHVLAALCQITLDREYLPFIPLRCGGPQGPLDPRLVTLTQAPDGFWKDSAENVFRASRDIVDIVEICRDKLPQSSLTLFAIWTAAFMSIYAHHFPHMDTKHQMVSRKDIERRAAGDLDMEKGWTAGITYHSLNRMVGYLQGAAAYLKHCQIMDDYFTQVEREFHQPYEKGKSPTDVSEERRLSIRLGEDRGGGMEGEQPKVQSHRGSKDLSLILGEDQHPNPREGSSQAHGTVMEQGSSMGPPEGYPPGVDYNRLPRTPSLSFTAINYPPNAPSISSESLPSIVETPGERLASSDGRDAPKITAPQHPSQLEIPGHHLNSGASGLPEFSMDQFHLVESQRIGRVLNDLQDFSGAGSLGGFSWNDLDAEERPYSGLRPG